MPKKKTWGKPSVIVIDIGPCKYCKADYTSLILQQMNGEITRQDVLDYKCCDKKGKNEKNNN